MIEVLFLISLDTEYNLNRKTIFLPSRTIAPTTENRHSGYFNFLPRRSTPVVYQQSWAFNFGMYISKIFIISVFLLLLFYLIIDFTRTHILGSGNPSADVADDMSTDDSIDAIFHHYMT